MIRRLTTLGVAAAALAVAAAPASAAPNRTTTLTPGGDQFAWNGGPISGAAAFSEFGDAVPCGPGKECDDTLVRLTDRGQLVVKITSSDPNARDLDLYLHRSDDKGTAGTMLKASTGSASNESVTVGVAAGFYLARVVAATAARGTFKGTAGAGVLPPLSGDEATDFGPDPQTGSPPPPPPTSTPAAQSTESLGPITNLAPRSRTVRPSSRRRPRSLRGFASDRDGRVDYVDVAIVRRKGTRCSSLRSDGRLRSIRKCSAPTYLRARGTRRWSLRLRRALPAGRYTLLTRATDDKGLSEGGAGSGNRLTMRVR